MLMSKTRQIRIIQNKIRKDQDLKILFVTAIAISKAKTPILATPRKILVKILLPHLFLSVILLKIDFSISSLKNQSDLSCFSSSSVLTFGIETQIKT